MGRRTMRVDKVEGGSKLASAVVTVSGQRLMSSGTLLDNDKIAMLKKAGIRYVQIFERQYEEDIDTSVFNELLKNIEAPGATVAVETPEAFPAEVSPPSPPLPESGVDDVRRTTGALKLQLADDKKRYAQQIGDLYTTTSYTLGEPSPRVANGKDAPYVDLMALLARTMTDKLIFERKVDQAALQTLAKDVVSELSTRQNVMELLTTAYSVSRYLLSHMVNVSLFSMRLASEMKLSSSEITDISVGAMLHDIGMVMIPVGLWTTRRELAPPARLEVQKHTTLGAQLIRETPGAREEWAAPALEHHERLDGGGYPSGKNDSQLGVASRIVQICDVYEALTSDRSYRYAKFPDTSMKHILGSPDQFDREISQVFCKCLGFYPEGYSVKLSTGEQAVVVSANPKNVFRPVVRLLTDSSGASLPPDAQLEMDLIQRLDIRIVEISNRRHSAVS